MKPVMWGRGVVLTLCALVVTAAAVRQDNVLRFLSDRQVVHMAQENQPEHKEEQVSVSKVGVDSVECSGGKFQCPDGTTCCPLRSGQWACCPIPQAVCCSDDLHCCPHGDTCDVKAGTCNSTTTTIAQPWFTKIPATSRTEVVKCPGGGLCRDGFTCCKLKSGKYGCCPYPHATCCKDGVHCCPKDTTCDVPHQSCKKGDLFFPWGQKLPAQQRVESVNCPNSSQECPDGSTCCKLSSGKYGCCPLSDAVCCSDDIHCCPSGYKCDLEKGTCDKDQSSVPLLQKVPALSSVQAVMCPDGKSECPDGNTCCKLSSGSYGCCPLPNAVCCSDGVHCCPNGYTCDVAAGTCTKGPHSVALMQKVTAVQSVPDVVCPGGSSQCPDGNTCCKLSSGQYGCCPLPNAVCCSDGVHCCPNGYTCDVAAGSCTKGQHSVALMQKVTAMQSVQNVVCPDQSQCPSGSTCCLLKSGEYGCCPLPNAVCCSDGVHCCPNGYTCDVAAGTCTKGQHSVALMQKVTAAQSVQNVLCPDQSQCPCGNTCCLLKYGQYGCCPLPNAVCCSDGVHCCPNGYTCNPGMCKKGQHSVALMQKVTAVQSVPDIVCPDGQSQCPDGNTCCKLSSGGYGCCPLPSAVCCSDGVHCCPNGYTCNAGMCTKGQHSVALMQKVTAVQSVPDTVCPDGSQCPTGSTCCMLKSGQYGCCPLPNAVCCSDGVHCCPNGYTCNAGMCTKGQHSVALMQKVTTVQSVQNVVCPDGSQCPDGNTCCMLNSGQYGCCPLPNAVCCEDHVHCCPEFTTCDVGASTCLRGQQSVPMVKKVPAVQRVQNVVCPDHSSECPDGSTCCKLSSGNYGCCPEPNAVCCSDGVHCCPNGYTCDVAAGSCKKGPYSLALMHKMAAAESRP